MTRLGVVITEAIVLEYGRDELLRRLAHPFWFQSFGAVMGMDWHSSGITTSVIGALKRGLTPLAGELGIHVCGGRGNHSRQTPHELVAIGDRTGLDGAALARASRLVAKVDSAAVQDGFELYLHGFIVTDDGHWVVVQQGMNGDRRQARRYHWLSEGLRSFVDEPHAAIDGVEQGVIVNLTDRRAEASRLRQLDLLGDVGPDGIERQLAKLEEHRTSKTGNPALATASRHARPSRCQARGHRHSAIARQSRRRRRMRSARFLELLLVPGVGARTVRALAQVAEVVHGAPYRFSDPARFSVAHGGKDRHPFPVPLKVYDRTIHVLKSAVQKAKLGQFEELAAIKRLDEQARQLERHASGPSIEVLLADERRGRINTAVAAYLAQNCRRMDRRPWGFAFLDFELLSRSAGSRPLTRWRLVRRRGSGSCCFPSTAAPHPGRLAQCVAALERDGFFGPDSVVHESRARC